MNGIYDIRPQAKQFALLSGSPMVSCVPENNRVWWLLDFYQSDKSRMMAAKKKKRISPEAIFVTWEFTLEDIIKQGTMIFPQASDKILLSDKLDILSQLFKRK